jgi:hypothetical protein
MDKTSKAESKKQQRFFGMVHAVQKGELSPSEVGPAVRKAARNTEYSDAKDIASTKHKGLPEKVAGVLDAIMDNKKAILWEAGTTGAILGGTYAFYNPKSKKKREKKGSAQMKYFEKIARVDLANLQSKVDPSLSDGDKKKLLKLISEMYTGGIGKEKKRFAPLIGAGIGSLAAPVIGTLIGYLVGNRVKTNADEDSINQMNAFLAGHGFTYSEMKRMFTKI